MRRISLLPLLFAPAIAFAQPESSSEQSRYHYLSVGLTDVRHDVPGPDLKGNGLAIDFSVVARKHVHLFGGYEAFDFDNVPDADGERRTFGVGTHFGLTDRLSVYGRFGYIDTDLNLGAGSVDDDGGIVAAGLRYTIGNGWEIRGGGEYTNLDQAGSSSSFSLGGDMFITDAVTVSLDATDRDDSSLLVLGLRFYFDKQVLRGRRH
ncbi:MAG TPA: outer membrane beta-barrel protein [Gammaproteobacteria bacterium]|nr:outer membrane beta-barrel protein [Gammaproteobacteria bacterium]